jgi:hypothetical protein
MFTPLQTAPNIFTEEKMTAAEREAITSIIKNVFDQIVAGIAQGTNPAPFFFFCFSILCYLHMSGISCAIEGPADERRPEHVGGAGPFSY